MIGRVVSIKSKDTATVLVERMAEHPLYKKTFVRSKKYLVGTIEGIKEGDIVNFVNCKPISKRKFWKITKVLGRSLAEIAEEKLKKEAAEIIAEAVPAGRQEVPEEGKEESKIQSSKPDKEKETKEIKTSKVKKRKEKASL